MLPESDLSKAPSQPFDVAQQRFQGARQITVGGAGTAESVAQDGLSSCKTHHFSAPMGFAALNPSYELLSGRIGGMRRARPSLPRVRRESALFPALCKTRALSCWCG